MEPLEQPEDVFEYAKKFFSYFNYHKDIVRYRPLVITGCSGVGKGTLINMLIDRSPQLFELSISYTTRRPRQGEVHGREYYFVTKEEFEKVLLAVVRKSRRECLLSTARSMAITTVPTRANSWTS
jgi:hypothetical protein